MTTIIEVCSDYDMRFTVQDDNEQEASRYAYHPSEVEISSVVISGVAGPKFTKFLRDVGRSSALLNRASERQ